MSNSTGVDPRSLCTAVHIQIRSGDLCQGLMSVSQQRVWLQLILFIAETMYNL